MTTTHLVGRDGRPVGFAEAESIEEINRAIISGTFERRWVVDVHADGATCRTCLDGCAHGETVESALREHGLLTQ